MKKQRILAVAVLVLCIPVALFLFARLFGSKADAESLSLAHQSVQRAAVQCYALEGAYPDSLTYLEEHYGVSVDQAHYLVDYQYIAANLMPDITVLPRAD